MEGGTTVSKHRAALCSFLGPSMVPTVPLLFNFPNSRLTS